ncbi:DUF3618 domain-containing protein [Frankia sp. Cr2]|uniref:DUF3618 domain-containing protein n=1 Tax=Frankia sp. Cr2 TaxID=3073932 RepID=UPI002AD2C0CA|nr:DUF3618 domain-containing protein [Frankia sp. Cr2]
MAENPDSIKTEIETTRTRLANELAALSEKVRPAKVAGRTAEDARTVAAHTWERVATGAAGARVRLAGATEDLGPKASATAHKASVTAHRAKDTAGRTVHRVGQNPQVAGTAQHARAAASQTATKVSHNPHVTATADKVRESSEHTARTVATVRQRAVDNPRATRAVVVGVTGIAVTAALVAVVRRRSIRHTLVTALSDRARWQGTQTSASQRTLITDHEATGSGR